MSAQPVSAQPAPQPSQEPPAVARAMIAFAVALVIAGGCLTWALLAASGAAVAAVAAGGGVAAVVIVAAVTAAVADDIVVGIDVVERMRRADNGPLRIVEGGLCGIGVVAFEKFPAGIEIIIRVR